MNCYMGDIITYKSHSNSLNLGIVIGKSINNSQTYYLLKIKKGSDILSFNSCDKKELLLTEEIDDFDTHFVISNTHNYVWATAEEITGVLGNLVADQPDGKKPVITKQQTTTNQDKEISKQGRWLSGVDKYGKGYNRGNSGLEFL